MVTEQAITLSTSKGVKVTTTLTDDAARAICRNLNDSFAKDLARKRALTHDQRVWLHIKATEADKPKRTVELTGGRMLANIADILATGGKDLKYPKVRVLAENDRITLALSKGNVYVEDAEKWSDTYNDRPRRVYYGKIEGETFLPTRRCPDHIITALRAFAKDPIGEARRYGKVTGHCCFCGRPLTDEESTRNGYGPICAKRYGLDRAQHDDPDSAETHAFNAVMGDDPYEEERRIEDERNPIYGNLSGDAWKSAALKQAVDQEMHPEQSDCGCKGSGWILSDFDTWHECRHHYTGQRHPEDYEG